MAQLSRVTAQPVPSKYSTLTWCSPGDRVRVAVYVVGGWFFHASSRRVPSTHTRIPSSVRAVKVYVPPAKEWFPTHRAENPSVFTPLPGPPFPHVWSMAASHRLRTGTPDRTVLLKYWAWYWSTGQGEGGGGGGGGGAPVGLQAAPTQALSRA